MIQGLLRLLRIFRSQSEGLHFSARGVLFIKSLFKREYILIFGKELNEIRFKDDIDSSMYIKKGELSELKNTREMLKPPQWEFCLDMYDRVTDFFIAENGGGLICHISWIYYKGDPNRMIDLASDEAEIKYSLTMPEYRGRELYPQTLAKIQTYLKRKGYRRVLICVSEKNHASIKGIRKAGFDFITRVTLMKFMGVQLNKKKFIEGNKNWSE